MDAPGQGDLLSVAVAGFQLLKMDVSRADMGWGGAGAASASSAAATNTKGRSEEAVGRIILERTDG